MAVQNSDIRFRLIGQDVSAGKTFKGVGQEISGAKNALSSLGNTLGGVNGAFSPLENALGAVSQGFSHIQENGKSASVMLQGVGIAVAASGAALLAFGASAQQAKASLDQTFTDAGFAIGDYSAQVEAVTHQMAEFGHAAADSDTALSKLVVATQNPTKALGLMSTAADIATQKHISLADASQLLVSALAGNTRVFRAFGINLGSGKLSATELNQALAELQQRIGGTAQAQADTFSGRIKGLAVEFENAAEGLTKYAPALLTVGSIMTVVGSASQILATRHAAQAVSANAAAAAETRLAEAQGAAATSAGAEAVAVGALDAAQGAGLGIGTAFGAGIGGAGIVKTLGLGAGGFGLARALPTVGMSITPDMRTPGPDDPIVKNFVQNVLPQLRAQAGITDPVAVAKPMPIQLQQQLNQAAQSYFQALTPFATVKAPDNAKLQLGIRDDRQRLADAQAALDKAQNPTSTVNPATVASARAAISSAQAALMKARYNGSPAEVAADTDRLTAAQARLTAAEKGGTTASTSVADAEMKVRDARQKLTAATQTYNATKPLSVGQIFKNLGSDAESQTNIAHSVQTLINKGMDPQAISQLLDVEKTNPGTIANAAQNMSKAYITQIDQKFHRLKVDSKIITLAMTDKPAAERAAQANADAYLKALQGRLTHHKQYGSNGSVSRPGVSDFGNTTHIHHVEVKANDPAKFGREMDSKKRLAALAP